jgi:cobalt-zinc-cadmium resistance protein CzcA
LKNFIQLALSQRLLLLLLTSLLAVVGWQSMINTPIDAFPDITHPQVKIILKVAGMTPSEIETRVTALVETEMLGIPKQKRLRSLTKYGLTDITVDFEEGVDIYWARQQVNERLSAMVARLPSEMEGGIAPMTTPLSDVFMFTLESDSLSLSERRQWLDWVIRPSLRTIAGVADVNTLGGEVRTYEIAPDAQRMAALGITLEDIAQTISSNHQMTGAGRLDESEETLVVRLNGSQTGLDSLAALRITTKDNTPIRLADVAQVHLGSLARNGGVTHNGKGETVEAIVLAMTGANARMVVKGVEERLASLEAALPKDLHINVFYNRANLIERAVWTVTQSLIEAIILVLLLLIVFLSNWRAALTVAMILPLSALATFILMEQAHLSANLMSLGGLVIAIGMLVDAGVVVVENIVSRLHAGKSHRLPKQHLIARAVGEVSTPVAAGIAIIIIIFLPLLTLEDIEGKLFSPVALTIVFALASALVLALTVIPAIASMLLSGQHAFDEPQWLERLQIAYQAFLEGAIKRQTLIASISALSLVLAAVAYPNIGKIFIPTLDEGDIIVQLEKLPSISLNASLALDTKVQQSLLAEVPEITGIIARAGSDDIGLDPMGLNDTDSFLTLKPAAQWRIPNDKEALLTAIRDVLDRFYGINHTLTQPIEMRVSEMLTGTRGDVAIKIYGDNAQQLTQLAERIKTELTPITGAAEVFTPANNGVQYLQVTFDHDALRRYELNVDTLSQWIRSQLEGQAIGLMFEGNRRTPIMLRGDAQPSENLPELAQLPIPQTLAKGLRLSDVATLERSEGPVSIARENGQRMAVVLVNVNGRDLVSFVEEAQQKIKNTIALPAGYWLTWGGQFENQQRASQRLSIVIPLGLLMIAFLLLMLLESFKLTLITMLSVPFALVGGIIALYASGEYLSLPASIGFIALLGIAVLNSLVMVETWKHLRSEGHYGLTLVLMGAKRRLRPVLMTASIAALGLMPLLFATGPGSELQRPLAVVVIGGLVTSTLLTLVLLPLIYYRLVAQYDHTH